MPCADISIGPDLALLQYYVKGGEAAARCELAAHHHHHRRHDDHRRLLRPADPLLSEQVQPSSLKIPGMYVGDARKLHDMRRQRVHVREGGDVHWSRMGSVFFASSK